MAKLGKLVLVVAQRTALRAKIARLLQPAGYAVELAADERRALELAAHEGINAAILVIGSSVADLAFARRLSDRVPRLIVLAERPADSHYQNDRAGVRLVDAHAVG
jgi:DNA-binding response OmpR family regulator